MYKVGDKVSIDSAKHPGVWTVKSVGPVNVVLEPQGGGRGLRAPQSMLLPAGAEVKPWYEQKPFYPGEFARIDAGKFKGLYVVIADKGEKINVAPVGGDGGRYVRALRSSLVRLDAKDVLK